MFRTIAVIATAAAIATPALAQQTLSPSQTALQIDAVVNQWAQVIEASQKQLAADHQKIDSLQKEIDTLKAPPAPAKPVPTGGGN